MAINISTINASNAKICIAINAKQVLVHAKVVPLVTVDYHLLVCFANPQIVLIVMVTILPAPCALLGIT
jgi:hypothetical protein